MKIKNYIDGSCSGNPGPGGWCSILLYNSGNKELLFGNDPSTTNNRMELTAAIKTLEYINICNEIQIFTDSQYVYKGITMWISKWKKCGWINSKKQSVKNIDLWKKLDLLIKNKNFIIYWNWIPGHSGNNTNEQADILAKLASKKKLINNDKGYECVKLY